MWSERSLTSHLGDEPSRRQSSQQQTNLVTTNSATRVGQLGDNLLYLPHNISWAGPTEWVRIRRGGHSNTWYCSSIAPSIARRRGAWLKAYSINSRQFLLLRLQQVPTVGVFLFLTHQLECSVGRLSRTVNGIFGTLFDLNSPTQYLRGLDGPSGRCVAAPRKGCCVSDHKIYDTVVPQMYRSRSGWADIL